MEKEKLIEYKNKLKEKYKKNKLNFYTEDGRMCVEFWIKGERYAAALGNKKDTTWFFMSIKNTIN
jgi:hypothetical protein